jgi:hypothetical protein
MISRFVPPQTDFLDAWVEATGEAVARGDVEIEKRALLDRRELQAAGDGLRERRLPVPMELPAEPFIRGQLADHLFDAAL